MHAVHGRAGRGAPLPAPTAEHRRTVADRRSSSSTPGCTPSSTGTAARATGARLRSSAASCTTGWRDAQPGAIGSDPHRRRGRAGRRRHEVRSTSKAATARSSPGSSPSSAPMPRCTSAACCRASEMATWPESSPVCKLGSATSGSADRPRRDELRCVLRRRRPGSVRREPACNCSATRCSASPLPATRRRAGRSSRPALHRVIGVGAVTAAGRAWFSNFGGWVDACAPGVDVVSTFFDFSEDLALFPDARRSQAAGVPRVGELERDELLGAEGRRRARPGDVPQPQRRRLRPDHRPRGLAPADDPRSPAHARPRRRVQRMTDDDAGGRSTSSRRASAASPRSCGAGGSVWASTPVVGSSLPDPTPSRSTSPAGRSAARRFSGSSSSSTATTRRRTSSRPGRPACSPCASRPRSATVAASRAGGSTHSTTPSPASTPTTSRPSSTTSCSVPTRRSPRCSAAPSPGRRRRHRHRITVTTPENKAVLITTAEPTVAPSYLRRRARSRRPSPATSAGHRHRPADGVAAAGRTSPSTPFCGRPTGASQRVHLHKGWRKNPDVDAIDDEDEHDDDGSGTARLRGRARHVHHRHRAPGLPGRRSSARPACCRASARDRSPVCARRSGG